MKLLLFSNSTNAGEKYLSYTLPYINEFLNAKPVNALFIPYAGVSITWDDYYTKVKTELSTIGIKLISIHHQQNHQEALEKAEVIIVGGGNTFNLLKTVQDMKIMATISNQVKKGIPYIGWSAGSNLACPTICTTNDMPIVEPLNFKALNLIPFQINAHYTDASIENHAGETREMRINEFLIANSKIYVAGLREGTMFRIENDLIKLQGDKSCRIFKQNHDAKEFMTSNDFLFLMK
jgi:dipeptidase E